MNIPVIEQFRLIDGFENYQISNLGRVLNVKTGKILKHGTDGPGYYCVTFLKIGKNRKTRVFC